MQPHPPEPQGGDDAICFTAGPAGAVFGAGTIHAYLAAERKPPAIVAGISMGAVSAVAMQTAYREAAKGAGLPAPAEEAARWQWFRKYLQEFTDNSWAVLWEALPDQSDFFADMIPIRDSAAPDYLKPVERDARRRRYLLVRLGRWLARLPLRVGRVAQLIVSWVRVQEKFPAFQRFKSALSVLWSALVLVTQLVIYAMLSPEMFPDYQFDAPAAERGASPPFGWRILGAFNLVSLIFGLIIIALVGIGGFAGSFPDAVSRKVGEWFPRIWFSVGAVVVLLWGISFTARLRRWIISRPFVRRFVSPVIRAFIYGGSIFNFVTLLALGGAIIWAIVGHSDAAGIAIVIGFFWLLVSFIVSVPLAAVPELRHWMVRRGLLPKLRLRIQRPLFGWPIFSFLTVHAISLICYTETCIILLIYHGYHALHPERGDEANARLEIVKRLLPAICACVAPFASALILAIGAWFLRRCVMRSDWLKRRATAYPLVWRGAVAVLMAVAWWVAWKLLTLIGAFFPSDTPDLLIYYLSGAVLNLTWVRIFTVASIPEVGRPVISDILKQVGLLKGIVPHYHLSYRLAKLFDPAWSVSHDSTTHVGAVLSEDPMPVLIVAAPLQTLTLNDKPKDAMQLWARTGTPLVDALRTALALPPLFEPTLLRTPEERECWLSADLEQEWKAKNKKEPLALVDGSVVRQNPIPALFTYLRRNPTSPVVATLTAGQRRNRRPAIHVVYSVPIRPRSGAEIPTSDTPPDIIDVGIRSMTLSKRRDTQLEVINTNFLSALERMIPEGVPGPEGTRAPETVFADEIAPDQELEFKRPLDPSRDDVLAVVAAGCRASLERLYRDDLRAIPGEGHVPCRELLVRITDRRAGFLGETPGLPEVCRRCTQQLRKPKPHDTVSPLVSLVASIGERTQLLKTFPNLSGAEPRIVFLANGGVFRGAFHIGMVAALGDCNIQPDLIVGASVGTLMGGALGAMFAFQRDTLDRLVKTFLHVDDKVALTKTVKAAARELGLRGRAVHLSPRDIHRMVHRGSRSDAGFAVSGAPAALIDAISDLFMVPHRQTSRIAAAFVAGHVAEAVQLFGTQLKRETLSRMGIETSVIGTSLLEIAARDLLGEQIAPAGARQPFAGFSQSRPIAYFGDTTDLGTQSSVLLGGWGLYPGAPYDYVEAALSSSAFPAVFAPRRQSSVFPGAGLPNVFYSDGGLFDNLPFLPAVQILSQAQLAHLEAHPKERVMDCLQARHDRPDLILAGALDVLPSRAEDRDGPYDSILATKQRADSLQDNVKLVSMQMTAESVHRQVGRLLTSGATPASQRELDFLKGVVVCKVMSIYPRSKDHLNGTFAFCKSMGMDQKRIQRSIANGCYETLAGFAKMQAPADPNDESTQTGTKCMDALVQLGRIPMIRRREDRRTAMDECPHFMRGTPNPAAFTCPFAKASMSDESHEVHWACVRDGTAPQR